jgi:hypothetical protein
VVSYKNSDKLSCLLIFMDFAIGLPNSSQKERKNLDWLVMVSRTLKKKQYTSSESRSQDHACFSSFWALETTIWLNPDCLVWRLGVLKTLIPMFQAITNHTLETEIISNLSPSEDSGKSPTKTRRTTQLSPASIS